MAEEKVSLLQLVDEAIQANEMGRHDRVGLGLAAIRRKVVMLNGYRVRYPDGKYAVAGFRRYARSVTGKTWGRASSLKGAITHALQYSWQFDGGSLEARDMVVVEPWGTEVPLMEWYGRYSKAKRTDRE